MTLAKRLEKLEATSYQNSAPRVWVWTEHHDDGVMVRSDGLRLSMADYEREREDRRVLASHQGSPPRAGNRVTGIVIKHVERMD
jgi:hypothetical protein